MRLRQICIVIILIVSGRESVLDADHGREIRPKSWQRDATINDVFALNENVAWAVGDQGLILRTTDGGESWIASEGVGLDLDGNRSLEDKLGNMRPISQTHELYPLTCSFKSVFFLNEQRGWIAGAYHTPYLRTSRSVILTTVDGGKSWHQFKANLLPEISRIHFQDVLGGWAIGNSGNLFNSGVFATSTGGQRWSVQEVKPSKNWIDGELAKDGFIVIDDEGVIGRITGKNFEPAVVLGNRPGQLKSVRMLDRHIGWAVGNNGTVLQTKDGGQTWQRPDSLKNDDRLSWFDFATVFIREGRVWIAGNPGTTVISLDARSADGIEFRLTNQSFPIHKLNFASRQKGWAVGSGGRIIATTDGGDNWRAQRDPVDQAAILIVSHEANDLPYALLSSYSNERNYISGLLLLGKRSKLECDLARFAVNRLGCSTFISIVGDDLEEEPPVGLTDSLLMELIRSIRTMRPNVVVCNRVPGVSDNELHVLCRTAIDMAARNDAFTEHMDELALEPWQIDRYMIRQPKASEINFKGSRYLPKTGKLLEDQIAISRGITGLSSRPTADECYAVESFTGTVSAKRDDVFFGLKQLGKAVPIRNGNYRMGNLNSIATAPLKNQEFKRLLSMNDDTSEQVQEMQREIRSFATGIEAQETGVWMMQLADSFLDQGNMEAAAYTLEEMVSRYSEHSLTPAALMWLAQYYSSEEASVSLHVRRQRIDKQHSEVTQKRTFEGLEPKLVRSSPITTNSNGIRQVSWEVEEPETSASDDVQFERENDAETSVAEEKAVAKAVDEYRARKASQFLSQLKQQDLDFAQNANVQFMEAMIINKLPGSVSNGNLLKRIKRKARQDTGFSFAASRELRVRDEAKTLKMVSCYYTDNRPRLDGNLEDDIWQNAIENGEAQFKPVKPKGARKSVRNDVCWLAFDDQFLYLAARCNKIDQLTYQASQQPRTRDSNLAAFDRIQLKLDIDRDLQSEFCFEVDYSGRAFDSCAGAKGWNPKWYIATNEDAKAWVVELAIPLTELSSHAEQLDIAAISLKRLDPTSLDIWSNEKNRHPASISTGIAAGIRIAPADYEMLQFIHADQGKDKLMATNSTNE